ncbi:hypothetical protein [Paenibacillus sp. JDR-2]|uniref:hypothetical protein n=1 Tax=Paenibacillus sp. (strain JDR-2) TaxID=324057 RepID=UPI00059F773A|nr:hypothetical protein [Paenibacillus sp. JDR-2]
MYKRVDPNETEIDRIIASNDIYALINLIDAGLCFEVEDEYGRTLIENAAIAANDEMIMFLFKKGAEFFDEHKKTVELINALLQTEER